MKTKIMFRVLVKMFCAAIVSLLAARTTVHAATHTWTGVGFFGNQDFLWSNPANWAPVGAPAVGESNVILIFPNDDSPKFTTNDIAGLNIAAIKFYGTNYEIHAKPGATPLKLGGGAAGNSWTVIVNANDCTFAKDCPLSLQSTGTVLVAEDIFFDNQAAISGPGGFTKDGPGFFFLFADTANTYAGTTILADGLLGLGHGRLSASGVGTTAIPGALIVGGQPGMTIPTVRVLNDNQFSSSSAVTVLSPSEVMLWGTTNTFGSLTIQDGAELTTGPLGSEADWPGLLKLNGNIFGIGNSNGYTDSIIRGHVSLGSAQRTFNVQYDASLSLRADVYGTSASAGITKTGEGDLSLEGVNTYDGPTLIQAGELYAETGNCLGSTINGTTVSPGGALVVREDILVNEALTLNGPSGVPALRTTGYTNTFAGPITLNGICEVEVYDAEEYGGGKLTLSGAINGSGGLRSTGGGVLEFTGFGGNNFTGGLFVEHGTTCLNKSASAPALSGPLVVGQPNGLSYPSAVVLVQQINQIPNTVPVSLLVNGYLDGIAADTLGNIEFSGGVLEGQIFTVTGNITNHTTVSDGTIENSIILSSGTHFIHCDTNSLLLVDADLQGAGAAITKTGPGNLQFTKANTYSGITTVQSGELTLKAAGRPGSTAAGTFVETGAKLYLFNCSVTNETLTFDGASANGVNLVSKGNNRWMGSIVLNADLGIQASDYLTLDGGISGGGGVNYLYFNGITKGTVELTGSVNSFTGDSVIQGGDLRLNKPAGLAVPGNLDIGGSNYNCTVLLMQPNQIGDSAALTIDSNDWLDLNGNAETIGSLNGSGNVSLGAATLVSGGNGNTTTFSGLIYGTGGFTKTGAGMLTLSGDNSYTGPTLINGGTLLVNGQQPFSSVSVSSGGKLGGTGRVGNTVVNNNATISPGASPGILATGNLLMGGSTAVAQIEINGTTPGAGHDQLKANGSTSFIGGTLQVLMNIGGSISNQYVIVDNDGVDAVSGTFTGLSEGSWLTNNGATFVITYHGGDSNDVALIQQSVGYVSQIIDGHKLLNGRFALKGIGAPNASYAVEAATNLNTPIIWTQVGTAIANGQGEIQFSDAGAPLNPIRFYRFRHQ